MADGLEVASDLAINCKMYIIMHGIIDIIAAHAVCSIELNHLIILIIVFHSTN